MSNSLSFEMQHQQQTEWCWAAVSTSVSRFYDTASGWTQCTVANAEFSETSCCTDGTSEQCNQPWFLDKALQRVGRLNVKSQGSIAFAAICGEINAGRPIGIRIGWEGDGGHFITIYGYQDDNMVLVADPLFGDSTLPHDELVNKYE